MFMWSWCQRVITFWYNCSTLHGKGADLSALDQPSALIQPFVLEKPFKIIKSNH